MNPEGFCSYYLESRNIAIVNETPQNTIDDQLLQQAIQLTMNISGVNPVRLAAYPDIMSKIEAALKRSNAIQNIEDTFMKRLMVCFKEVKSLSTYVEELLKSDKPQTILLAQRILAQLQEIEECAICFSNTCNTFFQCGHRVCGDCSKALKECPFCRTTITSRLKEITDREEALKKKKQETKKRILTRFRLVEGNIPQFIESRFLGLMKRSSTLDNATAKELAKIIEFYPSILLDLFKKNSNTIRAEEVVTFLCGKLFFFVVLDGKLNHTKWTDSQTETAEFLAKKIHTPSRLIRFLTTISKDEAVKDEKVQIKLSNRFRTWVVKVIDGFELLQAETEIGQRMGFWVWLFKKLHIRESRWKKYTKARDLADFARGNRKKTSKSVMNEFNELYKKADTKILDFFIKSPGLAFRFFRCTLATLQYVVKDSEWSEFLGKIFPKMKPVHLIELLHILRSIPSLEKENPVYRIKNGQLYWPKNAAHPVFESERVKVTQEAVIKAIKNVPYRLVVDTSFPLENFRLARGRPPKVPEWVPAVLASGDVIKVDPKNTVVMFVHWMNGAARVDLDLSVMCMDKTGKKCGMCDYTRLSAFNNTIKHSGDYTDAPPPNGCSEYITFSPAAVLKVAPQVKELFSLCFSFNAVPFDEMGQAFVGIGVMNSEKNGLGPNGCHVIAGCELRGSCQVNMTSKYDFERHEFTFLNTNVTSKKGAYSIKTASRQIADVSQKFTTWLNTRSPATFDEVVKTFYLGSSEVKLVDGSKSRFFKKKNEESNVDFQKRVVGGKEEDKILEDSTTKVCYFGDNEKLTDEYTKSWPQNSLVIAKSDPKCASNVIWSSDPYSVFN